MKKRLLSLLLLHSLHTLAAPIAGFTRSFPFNKPIPNGVVTILETGQIIPVTDEGKFGPFDYPAGKRITLVYSKEGYHPVQSGTFLVPAEGFNAPNNNITFQVPANWVYQILIHATGASLKPGFCHVVTTVTPSNMTLHVAPQGIPGAKIVVTPTISDPPFYFDMFHFWPLYAETNPFTRGLTETTEDGGVGLMNVPPSDKLYRMTATKPGLAFSEVQFWCRKDVLINISPPKGPVAIEN